MKSNYWQNRYPGSSWSLICGLLALAILVVRLYFVYVRDYTWLPVLLNVAVSLFFLFCAIRFFRQYFCYVRLNNEQMVLAGVFRDKKIYLPDIEQMSFHKKDKNTIHILMEDGEELKINLLDISAKRRSDFKKAFYIKK